MALQLVTLPVVQRLSPRCIRILGGNPGTFTLQGTNTYLLGTGHKRILVDTGEGKSPWLSSVRSTLEAEQATIDIALLSHWHHDHTGGIADLISLVPDVQIYKYDPVTQQHAMVDGQQFSVEGATLTAVHTPGHTSDHFVFVLEEENAMFSADNVLGQGTAVFEDMSEYLKSLRKMQGLFSGKAYPGHGPVLEDGPGTIVQYIEHRQQRIKQVIEAMRGPDSSHVRGDVWSAMDIVKNVYRDVPTDLHLAACGGVLQILDKLVKDGMVCRHGDDQWQLAPDKSAL